MIDAALFKTGMRRLAAGVCLVTATDRDGVRQGLIATSVISVTVEPPSLLVCVNRAASCHDTIADSGAFCVNLLTEADDEVARRFGSSAARERRFADRQWRALETGAPALDGALASFDCRVSTRVPVGSHTIFIGAVVALALREGAGAPLLYLDGDFARLASAS
jgi:flavin reductase